jgi:hypothetical protein
LTAQNTAKVSSTFAITNSPADSAWHSAISSITVNGSTLPSAAYNATASGQIVFNPTQSVSLQGSGAKTIAITAAGYSTATVTQTISGITPLTLGGATLNGGNLEFAFTSTPGLTFTVLSSTNLALPTSHWQVLGTATEGPSGSYQFTDPNPATNSAVFYTVVQP